MDGDDEEDEEEDDDDEEDEEDDDEDETDESSIMKNGAVSPSESCWLLASTCSSIVVGLCQVCSK